MPDVLYVDNHVLAVNKPSGLLAQADSQGGRDLLNESKEFIKRRFRKPGNVFLGLVHRLDKPVSGVMIFARTSKAARRLSEEFRERRVHKVYLAAVEGRCVGEGVLEDYLVKKDGRVLIAKKGKQGAKFARLRWKSHRIIGQKSLLEVQPETGRAHQIRIQLSKLGFPIVGDTRYGASKRLPNGNIALHSLCLKVRHPTKGQDIVVTARPPAYPGVEWMELADELVEVYSAGIS